MLKYVDVREVFSEIPDEITLAINISNCPCYCPGCHSDYLAQDIGEEIYPETIVDFYEKYNGVSCICFMGGDSDPKWINILAEFVKVNIPKWKVAWYSGRQELSTDVNLENFDYIKLGPYVEELGPLNSPKTNQRLYKVQYTSEGKLFLADITYKFWKDEDVGSSTNNAEHI